MKEIQELEKLIKNGYIQSPKNPKYPIYDFIDDYRHQLEDLMHFLNDQAFFNKKDLVLEIGTGSGSFMSLISPLVQWIITCEIDEEHVMEAVQTINYFKLKNVKLFWGSVEELNYNGFKVNFPNETFDKVVAHSSFQRPIEIEKFIIMAKKVRKSCGKILLSFNPYHFKTDEEKLSRHENLSRKIYLRRKGKPKIYFEDILKGLIIQAGHVNYKKFPLPEQAYIELAKYFKGNEINLIKDKGHIYPIRTVLLR
ncbi:MAG: tRNA (guanine-N(7)-)-methyltransferase [Candidatus Heimdallarchaeota archaeon LC_3]|nr:MAG: tRNA (guanine-N(7)-)-methyltransferase [Candidatus Heimdallarchaeota archaeon LC_3]